MGMYQKIQKGSEEWVFWQDLYKFRQDHHNVTLQREFEQMVEDADKIYKKFQDTDVKILARETLITLVSLAEQKYYKFGAYKPTNEFVALKESEVMHGEALG